MVMRGVAKHLNEQVASALTKRTDNGAGQFLDASDNSHVFAPMAGRATSYRPMVFTNSSRKAKSLPEVNSRASEAKKM